MEETSWEARATQLVKKLSTSHGHRISCMKADKPVFSSHTYFQIEILKCNV